MFIFEKNFAPEQKKPEKTSHFKRKSEIGSLLFGPLMVQ